MTNTDDLESLEETLEVLSNSALASDIRRSLEELGSAPGATPTREQVLRLVNRG